MRLSETEGLFVAAVQREFRFLVLEHGFIDEPVEWNGQGISVDHVSQTLEVSNYLESGETYTTFIFPLHAGARLPTFDHDMDEPFSFFLVEDLVTGPPPRGVAAGTFPERDDLLNAVAPRAALLRNHIKALVVDPDTTIAQVRDRRREKLL